MRSTHSVADTPQSEAITSIAGICARATNGQAAMAPNAATKSAPIAPRYQRSLLWRVAPVQL
jgi:hypothetical protein